MDLNQILQNNLEYTITYRCVYLCFNGSLNVIKCHKTKWQNFKYQIHPK